MKIRCINNSIRIRLRKSELEKLFENRLISEAVRFPNKTSFKYGLLISKDIDEVTANFYRNTINIVIPDNIFEAWYHSDHISIENNIELNEKEQLQLLIEKDLPCVDRPEEDKSDTFEELVDKGRIC